MSIAEKLTTVAENQQKVYDAGFAKGQENGGYTEGYEAGKQAEYDRFWDAYQQNGERTDYGHAFYGASWTTETFRPKYDLNPTDATYMFSYALRGVDLEAHLNACGVKLDTSACTNVNRMFSRSVINVIPELDFRNVTGSVSLDEVFLYTWVPTIRKIILNDTGTQNCDRLFYGTTGLKEVRFEGVIGYPLRFEQCSGLSNESVQSIIDHLKDLTGETAKKIYFHSTVLANLTDEQYNAITAKNWSI